MKSLCGVVCAGLLSICLPLVAAEKPAADNPTAQLKVLPGFQVEQLYSVPRDTEGSWVSMCVDPHGRLIVCDQYGGLFRVTPPGINHAEELKLEKIDVPLGEAQGLLWANDSLYVVVNKVQKYQSGLYRVRDTNNDDQLDHVELLHSLADGSGEHGPHGIVLSPDGKSLFIVCGNKVPVAGYTATRVPPIWDEDVILPRVYGKGFMRETPAPGGVVIRTDSDGKTWEVVTAGLRNPYDLAFNADGELFTFDADMEWDMNMPWYRPTRVCHVLSGADYGWRNGSAKFPEYYADTLPPVVNIGPGSPTGICFGYDAKFPAKYQKALYLCDWSYGKLFAVHMEPQGSTYTATFEEFASGTPLPFTDVVINPHDGNLYFTTGGRKIQSALYRLRYVGNESTSPANAHDVAGADARKLRQELETLHLGDHPDAVDTAWPHLAAEDRALRAAARVVLERTPFHQWGGRALNESNPQTRVESLMALCRQQRRPTKNDQVAVDTPVPNWDDVTGPDGAASVMQMAVLTSLADLNWNTLQPQLQLEGLRVLQLAMLRFGPPESEVHQALLNQLGENLPAKASAGNAMLMDTLVFLQAEQVAAAGVRLLEEAPSSSEQIQYAKALSQLREGWTPELRQRYFKWFITSRSYHGGASFRLFIDDIRNAAVANVPPGALAEIQPLLDQATAADAPAALPSRPFVKDWSLDELVTLAGKGLKNRDFDHGRKMFAAAQCYSCHQFQGDGGALGPDLTALAGRFDVAAILESIIEPSKAISDQYAAVQVLTTDGRVIIGRIGHQVGNTISIYPDMLNMSDMIRVKDDEVEEIQLSKLSMMPKGLLNTLNEDEVLDLLAFLLSRGDRNAEPFRAE